MCRRYMMLGEIRVVACIAACVLGLFHLDVRHS